MGLGLPHNVVVEVDLEDEPGLLEQGYRFPVQASKHLAGSPKSMDRERPFVDPDVVWPAESATNSSMSLEFAPGSSLEGAMMLREASPSTEVRLDNPAADVWNRLMFLSHQREQARQVFENRPENLDKTKRQLNSVNRRSAKYTVHACRPNAKCTRPPRGSISSRT